MNELGFMSLQTMFYVLGGASLLLAAAVLALSVRLQRLTGSKRGASSEEPSAIAVADLERRLSELVTQVGQVRELAERTIQHVGVVRYDAFQDAGGHISFSLALLDHHRNGVVLSVLNGREASRSYAKAIQGGRSSLPLSEEEERALAEAFRRGGAS